MKNLSRLLLIALFLAFLSGCAGTYTAVGTESGQPNYRSDCGMMDQQECHNWFYGGGGGS